MRNVLVSWEYPTTRQEGGPLPAEEIAKVDAYLSADAGANFTGPIAVPAPALNVPFNDLPAGSYIVRLIVEDTGGLRSVGIDTPFDVADTSAPGDVQNVTVTFP